MRCLSWLRFGWAPVCAALALTLPKHPGQARVRFHASPTTAGFEPNAGQTDPCVRFLLRGRGYGVFLTPGEIVLSLAGDGRASAVRLRFAEANAAAEIDGVDSLEGRVNYLTGRDPAKWLRGIPTFDAVRYRQLYPGVDLRLYRGDSSLEYDFEVAPHSNPSQIRVSISGARKLSLDSDGNLIAALESSELRISRPRAYEGAARNRTVRASFTIEADNTIGFAIGPRDASLPLTIDPVLSYSSYLGGVANENPASIAVDAAGNAYLAGDTPSADFPLSSPEQPQNAGQKDIVVSKINAAGTAWVYSTYIGGSGTDSGRAIAVDSSGNAYVAGLSASADFPVMNPYQGVLSGPQDAVIAKLNSSGSGLLYSSYLGGAGSEAANSIAVNPGGIYIAGDTTSTNFPLKNATQTTLGGASDGFLARFDPTGAALLFATYLGGSAVETARSVAVDATGNIYVAGETASPNFPVKNALDPALSGPSDAFAVKINAPGAALVFATYLGGSGSDGAYGVALDSFGNPVIAGYTNSAAFPTKNALRATPVGGIDSFVTKLAASGASILFSTYLGGTGDDIARAIATDAAGNIYAAGDTTSTNFPVVQAVQNVPGGALDGFVTAIAANGASLIYSTYLGGSAADSITGIGSDVPGNAVAAGSTSSANFPLNNALQPYLAGGQDAFAARFFQNGPVLSVAPASLSFAAQAVGSSSSAMPVTITNTGNVVAGLGTISASGDYLVTSNCGTTLAPNASCAAFVTFKPAFAGLRNGAISIPATIPGGLRIVPLSGTGTAAIPQIGSISPVSVAPGGPGFTVTINGSGFISGAVVNWNGSARPTTFVSATQLTANISAADIAQAGTAIITVTNAAQFGPTLANHQLFLTGTGRGVTVSDWSQPDDILYNREDANKCMQIHAIRHDGTNDRCLTCGQSGFNGGIAFHNGKISPDGQWIVMQVTVAGSGGCPTIDGGPGSGSNQEIWLASYPTLQNQARVSAACVLSRCGNLIPIWNPQQTQIAYGNRQSLCINPGPPDCPMKMALTSVSFPGGVPSIGPTNYVDVNGANPGTVEPWTWSADGTLIYYSGHDPIHPYPSLSVNSLRLADNSVTVLTPGNGNTWNEFPTIAKNNSGIFFSSTRHSPAECTIAGCPQPLFPLNDLNFTNLDGSRSVPLTGFNIPGAPDYFAGLPKAANGITLSPSGTMGLIDEETPGTAKWISMVNVVWPPALASNPMQLSVAAPRDAIFGLTPLPAGMSSAGLAAADLNGDGFPDLAGVNFQPLAAGGSPQAAVALGNGDGTFRPAVIMPTGASPNAIAIGDLNGDGIADLITANFQGPGVSVLLGAGNGQYQPHVDYPAGSGSEGIALGDVNEDGKLDVVVSNNNDGTLSVLLGNGDGTLRPQTAYAAGPAPHGILLGDFNGDSHLDVAVVNSVASSSVSILLGSGRGTFSNRAAFPTGSSTSISNYVAAADFNHDGKLDLVVGNTASFSVLLGTGDGGFQSHVDYGLVPGGAVATADINGDGKPDVVFGGAEIFLGNGDGTFQLLQLYVGNGGSSVVTADFDGDGRPDIAGNGFLLFQNSALISPHQIVFPDQTAGSSSAPAAVTLTNIQIFFNQLNITGITSSPDFPQTNNCTSPLNLNASCTVNVSFAPSSTGIKTGTLTITDTSQFSPHFVTLRGNAQAPTFSLNLSPNSVTGGGSTTANTITLFNAAPAGGLTCTLASSNTSVATVPANVTIAGGATVSPPFTISTVPVLVPAGPTITATCGTSAQSSTLTVLPAALSGVSLSPATTYGGLSTPANTVSLNGPAPSNGVVISLSSSNPQAASVPASVTIPGGASVSPSFPITTSAVATPTPVTITATYGSVSKTATLQVLPAALYMLALSPSAIGGGLPTKSNAVSLIGTAPAGGVPVSLSSSNPTAASVPASVTVAGGSSVSPVFTINTAGVTTPTAVTITASYAGVNKTATLTVNPAALYAIGLSATSVKGGTPVSNNLVALNGVAPAGGAIVQLASSNPLAASVPAAAFIPAGAAYSLPFTITTRAVTSSTPVTITATWNGGQASAQLTVTP